LVQHKKEKEKLGNRRFKIGIRTKSPDVTVYGSATLKKGGGAGGGGYAKTARGFSFF
jgi:hypothetical protein